MAKKNEGYDPRRSKISSDKLDAWRVASITGDLEEVPGIGPAAAKRLREPPEDGGDTEPITNTYQLFGKYLMLKGPDTEDYTVTVFQHNEKFWFFLKDRGISSYRSGIVQAVAERAATFFPGIYDATLYQTDENEDDN